MCDTNIEQGKEQEQEQVHETRTTRCHFNVSYPIPIPPSLCSPPLHYVAKSRGNGNRLKNILVMRKFSLFFICYVHLVRKIDPQSFVEKKLPEVPET